MKWFKDKKTKEETTLTCSICSGTKFSFAPVLWDDLAAKWQLSPTERAYVDRQQGKTCDQCGGSLRSIALADAIRHTVGTKLNLQKFVESPHAGGLRILEINEAATLSPIFQQMPGHTLVTYPAVDMHEMPYEEGSFDIVVHSDTLEHVEQPVRALAECRRVLRTGGSLCFTVPAIVGRMTRSRAGLAKSFHGNSATGAGDYLVQTEFGADMWTFVIEAGFGALTIHTVAFPDATAISARK